MSNKRACRFCLSRHRLGTFLGNVLVLSLLVILAVSFLAVGQRSPKLSGALQEILAQSQQGTFLPGAQHYAQIQGVEVTESKQHEIRMEVVVEGHGNLADQLRAHGGIIMARYKNLWQVKLPLSALPALAQVTTVSYMRLPQKAAFSQSPGVPAAPGSQHAGQGTTISEGVPLIGADQLHTHGITGKGIKIGIIDLGFAKLDQVIQRGELPKNIIAWNAKGSPQTSPGVVSSCRRVTPTELSAASVFAHGTAVAEIIHDVAPDAELHLYLVSTAVELGQAVQKAIEEGVQIINHSVGWCNTNFYDGTGFVDNIVHTAQQNGIFWVNAAGNYGRSHYEGTFQDEDGDNFNDTNITLTLKKGTPVTIWLTWDAWPRTDEDFDLVLVKGNKQVTSSTNKQNGTEPKEQIVFVPDEDGNYQVQIKWAGQGRPPSNRRMDLFVYGGPLLKMKPNTPESSVIAPADCSAAFAVGAVGINYWTLGKTESFSSRGPTNADLQKPDIVAPDCVSTIAYEGDPSLSVCGARGRFAGTSAAAPYVAGAAALLLCEDPSTTAQDLARILKERAQKIPNSTPDQVGAGKLFVMPLQNHADLVITSVEAKPQKGTPGTTVTIYAKIKNTGPKAAGSFWVTLLCAKEELGSKRVIGLTPNEEKELRLEWTVPRNQPPGKLQLTVSADPYDEVAERDESNNNLGFSIDIVGQSILKVSPQQLSFETEASGKNPASQSLTISNAGGQPLNWTATLQDKSSWLKLYPASGTIDPGKSATVQASVDITGLNARMYQDAVVITAPNVQGSPAHVAVTLKLTPRPPALKVNPTSLNFSAAKGGSDPVPQDLTITNIGGGVLEWEATSDANWLLPGLTGGSLEAGQSLQMRIFAHTQGLTTGTYKGVIKISPLGTGGSPINVAVTLEVR